MKDLDLHLSYEDNQCLQLLWRWKLLSTAALHMAAYRKRSAEGTYKRLLKLEQLKLIRATSATTGDSYVWLLENLGFQLVLRTLPELVEVGYKAENKEHDFWVTAIHLGDWLCQAPPDRDLCSEQQLRRLHRDQYPDWVPRYVDHRPDGWWRIGDGKTNSESLIALEVELSRKSSAEYKTVGEFYSTIVMPYQVIWVVRQESDVDRIHRQIQSGSKSNAEEQSYLLLEHYFHSQWQSKIIHGKNAGMSLANILGTSPSQSCLQGASSVLLDTRKKAINPTSHNKAKAFEQGASSRFLFI